MPFNVRTATATTPGGCPYNQDRVITLTTPDIVTLAVADGHGPQPNGELFAMWSIQAIAGDTTPYTELFAAIEESCRDRFRDHLRHRHLEEDGAFYTPRTLLPHRGGTTLSVVRIDTATGIITAANVGDSDVRYFDFQVTRPPEPETQPVITCLDTEGTPLTADHSPTNINEYRRALAECRPTLPAPVFTYDIPPSHCAPGTPTRPVFVPGGAGATDVCLNPAGGYAHATIRGDWGAYISSGDRIERLAMTRSIGDFHLKRFGVSAVPSLSADIPPSPSPSPSPSNDTEYIRVVVAASDGLWDACHYREIAEVIQKHLSVPVNLVKELRFLAEYLSTERFGDVHDNISIAVAVIRQTP
jgi:serine/threonine protein phosphatase PrpC